MTYHIPVMVKEVNEFLKDAKSVVDCTLGGGSHSFELKCQMPNVKIFGIDRDSEAIEEARKNLSKFSDITYIHGRFGEIKKLIKEPVDGFLFDLGVSSHQIDESSRGFSFRQDGPLDMRMGGRSASAADIVNNSSQDELFKIFKEYGEERFSGRIARAIVEKRQGKPIETTLELKEVIEKAIPTWKKRETNTRIFQALRIAVNGELDELKTALNDCVPLLNPGGRIVVISYHSLEDRIVKWFFREAAKPLDGDKTRGKDGILDILTKRPLTAGEEEVQDNPRAKSAKLRAAERT